MSIVAIVTDRPQEGQMHDTAYGASASIRQIDFDGHRLLVCAQEYADPRATVQSLKDLGAMHLWLCESVGALSPLLEVGDWLVPDDYIDGTRGQHYTYFSEKAGGYVQQVPPFDPASREALIKVMSDEYRVMSKKQNQGGRIFRRGVYVCVSNTRLETPAEAIFWTRAGGHIVGRFLSPCLTLARELEMKVAALVTVTRNGGEPGESAPFDSYVPILESALKSLA